MPCAQALGTLWWGVKGGIASLLAKGGVLCPARGDRGPHKIKDFVGWFTVNILLFFNTLLLALTGLIMKFGLSQGIY